MVIKKTGIKYRNKVDVKIIGSMYSQQIIKNDIEGRTYLNQTIDLKKTKK